MKELYIAHRNFVRSPTEKTWHQVCFAIIRTYEPKLERLAHGRHGCVLAEQFVDQAFNNLIKLKDRRAFFQEDFDFWAYLAMIYFNVERHYRRKALFHEQLNDHSLKATKEANVFELQVDRVLGEFSPWTKQLRYFFVERHQLISERQWAVLVLKKAMGYDHRRIGRTLKISPRTSTLHLHNAVKALESEKGRQLISAFWKEFN